MCGRGTLPLHEALRGAGVTLGEPDAGGWPSGGDSSGELPSISEDTQPTRRSEIRNRMRHRQSTRGATRDSAKSLTATRRALDGGCSQSFAESPIAKSTTHYEIQRT